MEIPDETSASGKGLWNVVDGTEVLADDPTAQARAEFAMKSQRVFSTMVLVRSFTL